MSLPSEESIMKKTENNTLTERLHIPSTVASPVGSPTNYFIEVNGTESFEIEFSHQSSVLPLNSSRRSSISNMSRRFSNLSIISRSGPEYNLEIASQLEDMKTKILTMESIIESNNRCLKRIVDKTEELNNIVKEKQFKNEFYKETVKKKKELCHCSGDCLVF
ncbi:hypothetical protein SteCoe_17202 [Stentor coeruleus]|uniref:Uncharacterized protein n=1 Tax=Stentor coeruleus TaxID=5963 RepID=A0A1R2BZG5_9CILI|nr:hypothetical protein SteCoe_17202 [Stentor coeruleus]